MQLQLWLLAYSLGAAAIGFVPLGWYFIEISEEHGSLRVRRRGEHCIVSGSLTGLAFVLAGVVVQTVMLAGDTGL